MHQGLLIGDVAAAGNSEWLIRANLYVPILQIGTVTNQHGFFSLTLPTDSLQLVISYIGYCSRSVTFILNTDRQARPSDIPLLARRIAQT